MFLVSPEWLVPKLTLVELYRKLLSLASWDAPVSYIYNRTRAGGVGFRRSLTSLIRLLGLRLAFGDEQL